MPQRSFSLHGGTGILMKKIFLTTSRIIAGIIILVILFFNIRIHFTPDFSKHEAITADVTSLLKYLQTKVHEEQLATTMQQQYPEGFLFTNALYGLAHCNLARHSTDSAFRNHAIAEAMFAYSEISSPSGYSTFTYDMIPHYGMFYLGWRNYLLGNILSVRSSDTALLKEFKSQCAVIASGFTLSSTPYLPSYPDQCWPADNVVAMASLKLHDEMMGNRYQLLINEWMAKVKTRLDPLTGLIPHSVKTADGTVKEGSRGSSETLMLTFLSKISPDFATSQFKQYSELFMTDICGLPAVREYPKGSDGHSDIDSGPVCFGIGGSATIVAPSTLAAYGGNHDAILLSKTIETFGFPSNPDQGKTFLNGQQPMADLFIAWTRSNLLDQVQTNEVPERQGSIVTFHIISLMIILALGYGVFFRKINNLFGKRV